jgi:hypothetical protein
MDYSYDELVADLKMGRELHFSFKGTIRPDRTGDGILLVQKTARVFAGPQLQTDGGRL